MTTYTKEELIFSAINHDLGKMGDSENEAYVPQTDQWRKEKLGEKTRIKIYGQKKSFLQRFGVKLINETEIYLEERAAFARFGL